MGEDSSNRRLMSRTSTSISVCFQDWVIQLAHRLALTRGISVRHYPALVSHTDFLQFELVLIK